MCFVFVFVALLEYAAVNYFFWGARAKKKKKKQRCIGPSSNALPGPGSNYQATYNSSNGRAPTAHEDRKVRSQIHNITQLLLSSQNTLYWYSP